MANGVRVRRDVYKLSPWDDALLWYARAVDEMRRRPVNDPTSWRYQTAIHDYNESDDPLGQSGDKRPPKSEQTKYWRQCQHGTWYFLPWHRMYLAYFEQIVAATIVKLGGPEGWSLPFWNYSDDSNPEARLIPPAFRERTLPDRRPNPLRIDARAPGANTGDNIAGAQQVNLQPAMNERRFAGVSSGGSPGFGGPQTGFHHTDGTVGTLERLPHGAMHGAVGGKDGWMSMFHTAPLDPIFWLHHSNIDRLWSVWRNSRAENVNPVDETWRSMSFAFHDARGSPVSLRCDQVIDTEAAPLHYRYEGVSTPSGPARPITEGLTVPEPVPEMVGANEEPVVLRGQVAETRLAVSPPTGPGRVTLESISRAPELYLNFENITSESGPTTYAVFINLPAGVNPREHMDHFVGILPMFGVREASRPGPGHSGTGLTYALEAGEVARRLEARQAWNPRDVRITFVPWYEGEGPRPALESLSHPIRVGRVSLYVVAQ